LTSSACCASTGAARHREAADVFFTPAVH
jgi:hypothetical protein